MRVCAKISLDQTNCIYVTQISRIFQCNHVLQKRAKLLKKEEKNTKGTPICFFCCVQEYCVHGGKDPYTYRNKDSNSDYLDGIHGVQKKKKKKEKKYEYLGSM